MEFLLQAWPGVKIFDVGCFSHTLNNAGKKIDMPKLHEYIKSWHQLLYSHGCKMLFKTTMGESMAGYSKVRWWASWEEFNQLQKPQINTKLSSFLSTCITHSYSVDSATKCLKYFMKILNDITLSCFVVWFS